jgi:hypothetical protein|nr:MAG TPA: hypothetical protein [Caudoviricetes sp.]
MKIVNLVISACRNPRVVVVIKIIFIIVFLLISLCNGNVDGALSAITTLVLN